LLLLSVSARAGAQAGAVPTIANRGPDRPLSWHFQARLTLGDNFRVFPWTVAADGRGRVYVLDVGDHRVGVFDSAGRHLRSLGGKGGGPGEFLQPAGIAAQNDGTVLVLDAAKGALVRFDSGGRVLDQLRLDERAAAVGAGDGETLIGQGPTSLEQFRLVALRDSLVTVLAEVDQSTRHVPFPGCAVSVPTRPVFAPEVVWASAHGTTAVNDTAAYSLAIWRRGRRVAIVTRDVPPIRVTRAEALKSSGVRNGFTVRWPGGSCRISPDELLETRGYARRVTPIVGIAVAPDGGFWVRRRTEVGGNHRTDVFDGRGVYLGTLPRESRFPSAFLSASRVVVVENDQDGVPAVVFYDVNRG
jgi:hypothetical protein